ncbi:phosphotransferase [Roseovarius nitratireducens]|uniref:phosphotransferase n=1 Tax=Roseovarius nitratireducens TaxID=2044597 RepID=UPI000CE1E8D8|nr:phosphotransferase [Roseovarius nitratireducens]
MSDPASLPELPAESDLPDGAEIGALIRHIPGKRRIHAGTWQGRDAIFRLATPETAEMQAREWQEACRIWPYMQGARFRTAEPLAFLPEIHLMVMERAPGTPLLDRIARLRADRRAARLAPAAAWLRRYTDVSEGWRAARCAGWLARAERATQGQPFPVLRGIEAGILSGIERIAGRIDGADWRVAICHGDFHPSNLLVNGRTLTGIDTGGSGRMPVLKDIARFLMHMARRGVCPSGRMWCGVDEGMRDAFVEAFALTEAERRLVLPFFVGIEALIRVETPALRPRRIRIAERVYAALRDDLATRDLT